MDGYSSDVFFHGDDDSYGSIDATRDEAICDLGFLGFWVQLNRCMGILGFWIWDCKKFGNLDSGKWRELNRAYVCLIFTLQESEREKHFGF